MRKHCRSPHLRGFHKSSYALSLLWRAWNLSASEERTRGWPAAQWGSSLRSDRRRALGRRLENRRVTLSPLIVIDFLEHVAMCRRKG